MQAGAAVGSVQRDRYGLGERHNGEPGHPSFSNSDPFYTGAAYLEPCSDPPHCRGAAAGAVRRRPAACVKDSVARASERTILATGG